MGGVAVFPEEVARVDTKPRAAHFPPNALEALPVGGSPSFLRLHRDERRKGFLDQAPLAPGRRVPRRFRKKLVIQFDVRSHEQQVHPVYRMCQFRLRDRLVESGLPRPVNRCARSTIMELQRFRSWQR